MTVELIKQTSRIRYLHSVAKLSAKENHTAKLLVTLQGGTFRVTQELIAFLSVKELGEEVIILDIYDTPVSVTRIKLLELAIECYQETMQSWLTVSEEINRSR